MVVVDGEELSEGGGVVEAEGSGGVEYRGSFLVDLLVRSEESQLDLSCRLVLCFFFFFKITYRLVLQIGIQQPMAIDMFEVSDDDVRLHSRVSAAVGF